MIYETHVYSSDTGEEGDLICPDLATAVEHVRDWLLRPGDETVVIVVRKTAGNLSPKPSKKPKK